MKKLFNFLALWSYPLGIAMVLLVDYLRYLLQSQPYEVTKDKVIMIALCGLVLPTIITLMNVWDFAVNGKKDFTPSISAKKNVTGNSKSKLLAMYPPIAPELLSKNTEGFLIGKKGKSYIRIPIEKKNIMHAVVLGTPGSGKSVALLGTLIANFMKDKPNFDVFCIDIKPELAKKSVSEGNENVEIVDFTDRYSFGWNVYYAISKKNSQNELMKTFDEISRALIVSTDPKSDFFTNNARSVMKGLLYYYFLNDYGFIDSIVKIMSDDILTQINTAIEDKEHCPEGSIVYSYLKKYANKDSEAMQDIELTLSERLTIFLNTDIQYSLRDNPKKSSPVSLNQHKSVFVCVPSHLLEEYSNLIRLITYQVCTAMESRPDEGNHNPTLLLLDEFARIGKIDTIQNLLAVGRSKAVSCCLLYQDQSQLEMIYGDSGARSIMNLCEITYVLSSKDVKTCNELSALIGDYREERISKNRSQMLHLSSSGKEQVSDDYRKIIEPVDFQSLRKNNEAIAIIEGKYYRIQKLKYYEDTVLSRQYQKVMKSHRKGD